MQKSFWIFIYKTIKINKKEKNTHRGCSECFLFRKAVYDEFDGKGLASCSLAMTKVYNIAMTEEGQRIELIVK